MISRNCRQLSWGALGMQRGKFKQQIAGRNCEVEKTHEYTRSSPQLNRMTLNEGLPFAIVLGNSKYFWRLVAYRTFFGIRKQPL